MSNFLGLISGHLPIFSTRTIGSPITLLLFDASQQKLGLFMSCKLSVTFADSLTQTFLLVWKLHWLALMVFGLPWAASTNQQSFGLATAFTFKTALITLLSLVWPGHAQQPPCAMRILYLTSLIWFYSWTLYIFRTLILTRWPDHKLCLLSNWWHSFKLCLPPGLYLGTDMDSIHPPKLLYLWDCVICYK